MMEINGLSPEVMADKLFQQVYEVMPDSTIWLSNEILFEATKNAVLSMLKTITDLRGFEGSEDYWKAVHDEVNKYH